MKIKLPELITQQEEGFTTIQAAQLPDMGPGEGKYSSDSYVDKGETPEDPFSWKHKEKLAILGTATTLYSAPYTDEDFEIWAVAQCVTYAAFKRADLLFEIHDESYWKQENVLKRLAATQIPIYMMEKYEEVPESIRFPLEYLTVYRKYHMTSITYMLGLAYHLFLTTGNPKHVSLYGIHMEAKEEYTDQRPCCEYWLGRMEGAGMEIAVPPVGAVLKAPHLYAYEGYNPVIPKLRSRLNSLQAGLVVRDREVKTKRDEYMKQDGAIQECAYWLRVFQKGEDQ